METLTVGHRKTVGGVPAETVFMYEERDESWESDWRDLVSSIEEARYPEVDAEGGLAVMRLVDEAYSHASASSLRTMSVSSRQ